MHCAQILLTLMPIYNCVYFNDGARFTPWDVNCSACTNSFGCARTQHTAMAFLFSPERLSPQEYNVATLTKAWKLFKMQ